uniref:Interleukin 21 n=1 Tax=Cyprinus carpio TaxID=7962 RepID=A0A8C1JW24_CYPCA
MKASVCFVFAVVCWIAEQAETPKILTLSKVMNELNKINHGMDKSTTLNSPTINHLKLNTDDRLIDWEKEEVLPTLPATTGSSLQHFSYTPRPPPEPLSSLLDLTFTV